MSSQDVTAGAEMAAVAASPFMNQSEFRLAARSLARSFEQNGHRQHDWDSVQLIESEDTPLLRVIRTPRPGSDNIKALLSDSCETPSEDEVDERDDEVRPHEISQSTPFAAVVVHYDILLSPTYLVPVLHISTSCQPITSLDTLYTLLVSQTHTPQLRAVGLAGVGGISMTNHPVTSRPVFFVHPCNTVEALRQAVPTTGEDGRLEDKAGEGRKAVLEKKRQITPEQYLRLWIGVVGGCVGLSVPVALAAADDMAGRGG